MKSFEHWDIYYLYEYAYSFMLHGDGDIKLIYFEHLGERFCYVVMQKDIADSEKFAGIIEKKNIMIGKHHMVMGDPWVIK